MLQSKAEFPGEPTTADAAAMVAWVETHVSEAACGYPITSSTTMGQGFENAVSAGKKNLWGTPLAFFEPESEHSAASACEGFAAAGGRVTNFTSGQGLVLMKEVLYTIAGKRLPAVFHIGARALTSQALNVHAGHDDVMAVADCGWGILFGRNAQEAGDLALIARRAAEACETPFMNAMDGFLTTHTVENVLLLEPELMKRFVGDPRKHLMNLMDPANPMMTGVVQNQDSYMKGKIAQRAFYDRMQPALQDAFDEFERLTGRKRGLIDAYRCEDAELVIVGMGSLMETCAATVDWARERLGTKVGCLNITAFRPFPGPEVVRALQRARAIAVVERMDNPPAQDNPLALEVKGALFDAASGKPGYPPLARIPVFYAGAAGLGSRDVRPGQFLALFEHCLKGRVTAAGRYFTLGIHHPTAIEPHGDPDVRPAGAFSMRGHSIGGYGSVTTNKVIASLVAEIFDLEVQAYPKYGSEKKGLPTTYYLTIASDHIRSHCELHEVDFIPLNDVHAFHQGDPLLGLQPHGRVFLQSESADPEDVWQQIPEPARARLLELEARVYFLDTVAVAREIASKPDLVQRMQGIVLLGVFLKVAPFAGEAGMDFEALHEGVERSLHKYFGKRGDKVVAENLECVRRGYAGALEIPRSVMEGAKSVLLS
ncbi:MAG TPA: 2-oxoacid:acceptor oxidoreductase family protein [Planctomycetota bacterium]